MNLSNQTNIIISHMHRNPPLVSPCTVAHHPRPLSHYLPTSDLRAFAILLRVSFPLTLLIPNNFLHRRRACGLSCRFYSIAKPSASITISLPLHCSSNPKRGSCLVDKGESPFDRNGTAELRLSIHIVCSTHF